MLFFRMLALAQSDLILFVEIPISQQDVREAHA